MTTTTTTSTPKLFCPECRRENEPERIYCHDCGTRLDRSAAARSKKEPIQDTHKRVKRMFDPHNVLNPGIMGETA
jgi:predicted amidophosphoribosyltransferase